MNDMSRDGSQESPPPAPPRPTRAEIETLCLLWAVTRGPCSPGELADRLGVTPEIGPILEGGLVELAAAEHVSVVAGIVSVTPAGTERMRSRLAALGIGPEAVEPA